MLEPPTRPLTEERDELLRRVDQRRELMRREHGSPAKSAMARPVRGGFCQCARCESVRRRTGDL